MSMAKYLGLCLLVGGVVIIMGCLFLGGCSSEEPVSEEFVPLEKWEYKRWMVVNEGYYLWSEKKTYKEEGLLLRKTIWDTEEGFYNTMGSQGWEFANKEEGRIAGSTRTTLILFKRRIS